MKIIPLFYRYHLAREIADEVLNFTWEKLNTGSWKDVNIAWRQVYSYASLIKAASLCGLYGDSCKEQTRKQHVQASWELSG